MRCAGQVIVVINHETTHIEDDEPSDTLRREWISEPAVAEESDRTHVEVGDESDNLLLFQIHPTVVSYEKKFVSYE